MAIIIIAVGIIVVLVVLDGIGPGGGTSRGTRPHRPPRRGRF